jgi:hypothetical protein
LVTVQSMIVAAEKTIETIQTPHPTVLPIDLARLAGCPPQPDEAQQEQSRNNPG